MSINFDPVQVPRCYSEWPVKVIAAARQKLRKELIENDEWHRKNIDADVIIEQTWNAICVALGHDAKANEKK